MRSAFASLAIRTPLLLTALIAPLFTNALEAQSPAPVTLSTGTISSSEASAPTASKTFFVRRDLVATGIAILGTAAVSSVDLRIARWARSDGVQGDSARRELVGDLTRVNETPLMLAALATYGVGRLARSSTTADVGLHTLEALVLTTSVSQVVRGVIGRSRPRAALEDPFDFKPGTGFSRFETRSFPSLHTAAAFATASALVGEIRERRPSATKYAAPLLYTAALVPGVTRMYLDQHWASDVVAGAFVGALLGSRVVSYAHSHNRTRLDRALLGVSVMQDGRGGTRVGVSLTR